MDLDANSEESKLSELSTEARKVTDQTITEEQSVIGTSTDGKKQQGRISSASVFRRGVAYFIDIIIINGFVYWQTSGYRDGGENHKAVIAATAIYFLLYFPLLEAYFLHATIGKALVGLKVVDQSGGGIKILRAFCRHFCKLFFGIFSASLSWFFAGLHPRGQAVHDVVAKTYVVVRRARLL